MAGDTQEDPPIVLLGPNVLKKPQAILGIFKNNVI
jgi:hypothetical protein